MAQVGTAKRRHADSQSTRGMTESEVLALPVMVSLEIANRVVSLGRTTGFQLAKTGKYPVKVHRLGNQYRVSRADLLRFLGIDTAGEASRGDAA